MTLEGTVQALDPDRNFRPEVAAQRKAIRAKAAELGYDLKGKSLFQITSYLSGLAAAGMLPHWHKEFASDVLGMQVVPTRGFFYGLPASAYQQAKTEKKIDILKELGHGLTIKYGERTDKKTNSFFGTDIDTNSVVLIAGPNSLYEKASRLVDNSSWWDETQVVREGGGFMAVYHRRSKAEGSVVRLARSIDRNLGLAPPGYQGFNNYTKSPMNVTDGLAKKAATGTLSNSYLLTQLKS